MLELYHDWRSFCSIKVRLCLAEKQLPWESRFVDLMKLEHTRPEYTRLNPNGVVPTLVHNGVPIIESTIINEYLEEVFPEISLVPSDPVERARMRAWVKFEDDVLHPSIRPATFTLMMSQELAKLSDVELDEQLAKHPNQQRAEEYRIAARSPVDHAAVEEAKVKMSKALDRLEKQLDTTPYLAGDSYSLADVAAAPFVDRLEELNFARLWDDRPSLSAWIARLKSRPSFSEAVPRRDQRFAAAVIA
ncbi:glutathione S-transferase family protein [Rhizorhabdus dicambivorans]|uniref:Glutathione S-transferase family protein n=2 Tax=Sphingomonadaceae TaxID=41297 RepID=A0A2A4FX57_9SPHN|nr:glutathione S-transferase family protein [Rhizorhabdus dicambivorans]ATE66119.1 glutathione S-transferase family protein [Rhizorhabdus dicambivorans]AWQ38078.1 glutathione S-transferase [Rhizorhabdus dicambivorans]PCE42043.1 glutathione S-transferase family protein [Rhizorhabdus dicambivorans]CAA12269.1 ORF 3 [Sphingomonas sp. RW5]